MPVLASQLGNAGLVQSLLSAQTPKQMPSTPQFGAVPPHARSGQPARHFPVAESHSGLAGSRQSALLAQAAKHTPSDVLQLGKLAIQSLPPVHRSTHRLEKQFGRSASQGTSGQAATHWLVRGLQLGSPGSVQSALSAQNAIEATVAEPELHATAASTASPKATTEQATLALRFIRAPKLRKTARNHREPHQEA
jgi:hypothetical protein